jgi:small ligand-binding sensory domain FIST
LTQGAAGVGSSGAAQRAAARNGMANTSFALGHAAGSDGIAAAKAAAAAFSEVPRDANLGFVYTTQEGAADLGAVVKVLRRETGVTNWLGAAGIGLCATGTEYFRRPAVAALVGSFAGDSFRLVDSQGGKNWKRLHPGPADEPAFGIVHGDPGGAEILRLLPAFAEETNSFLVGGLTSPEVDGSQVAGGVTSGGLSGALFASSVAVATGLSQGCTPIGGVRTITRCQRNVAIEIDGKPALEVFLADIGPELAENLRRAAGRIFVAFPVERSDRNDYVVRNIVGIDPERKLLGIGDMLEEGQKVMFCRRDAETARADLRRMLQDLKKRTKSGARGAVYCSCVARGPHLFDEHEEIRMIAEELGDVPLVGFYGSGEISHNRLYTQTGVLSLFL